MESFGKGNTNMYLGDGYNMLTNIVPRKSVDIAIIDNPFKLELEKKLWMYSAVGNVIKDDGILVVFDDERGWEETLPSINTYFHVICRTILWKGRPMRKIGEAKSNINYMQWVVPSINPLVNTGKEWHIQYLQDKPLINDNRISSAWYYNSSDKLGAAAKVKTLHRGSKGIGMAGFILSHLASFLKRDIVVVDPYGGSGTFAIASNLLGMTCYSSEIDADIFADAKTKFVYAMDKAKSDKHWFKQSVVEFQRNTVGPRKSTVRRPEKKKK